MNVVTQEMHELRSDENVEKAVSLLVLHKVKGIDVVSDEKFVLEALKISSCIVPIKDQGNGE